jgi:hypothetical protein
MLSEFLNKQTGPRVNPISIVVSSILYVYDQDIGGGWINPYTLDLQPLNLVFH